jgi:hypothetical protein
MTRDLKDVIGQWWRKGSYISTPTLTDYRLLECAELESDVEESNP